MSNDSWDLTGGTGAQTSIVAMYYALTSLSTIGFGDLYPKTDAERLYVAFMLLFGVAIFSFILGEISYMITSLNTLDQEIGQKEKLESFFLILEKFNYSR